MKILFIPVITQHIINYFTECTSFKLNNVEKTAGRTFGVECAHKKGEIKIDYFHHRKIVLNGLLFLRLLPLISLTQSDQYQIQQN